MEKLTMLPGARKDRIAFLRIVFDRLKTAGRFDPSTSLGRTS
jgi:hypothetical protein